MNIYKMYPISLLEEMYHSSLEPVINEMSFKSSDNLLIISDYSGDRKEDDLYNVHSFLFTNTTEAARIGAKIMAFKRKNKIGEKSHFEYKKVKKNKDKSRLRLFPQFLESISGFDALLITFMIENTFNIFPGGDSKIAEAYELLNFNKRPLHVARKTFETLFLKTYLLSKILSPHQSFCWLTDRDQRIGDNEIQKKDFLKIANHFLKVFKIESDSSKIYVQNDFIVDEDLNSIVDLSCGCLLEALDTLRKSTNITIGSRVFLDWFLKRDSEIKKKWFKIFAEKIEEIPIEKIKQDLRI